MRFVLLWGNQLSNSGVSDQIGRTKFFSGGIFILIPSQQCSLHPKTSFISIAGAMGAEVRRTLS